MELQNNAFIGDRETTGTQNCLEAIKVSAIQLNLPHIGWLLFVELNFF
jgi:hypothetical protein